MSNAADGGAANSTKWLSNGGMSFGGGALTVAFWVNITTNPGNFKLVNIGDGVTSKVFTHVQYYDSAGTKHLNFSRYRWGDNTNEIDVVQTLTVGTWYFVVMWYDGTNIKLYVNDAQVGATTAASGSGITAFTSGFGILRFFDATITTGYTQGLIDECGYWSRALTTTEMTDLYNGGNGQTMIEQAATGGHAGHLNMLKVG